MIPWWAVALVGRLCGWAIRVRVVNVNIALVDIDGHGRSGRGWGGLYRRLRGRRNWRWRNFYVIQVDIHNLVLNWSTHPRNPDSRVTVALHLSVETGGCGRTHRNVLIASYTGCLWPIRAFSDVCYVVSRSQREVSFGLRLLLLGFASEVGTSLIRFLLVVAVGC